MIYMNTKTTYMHRSMIRVLGGIGQSETGRDAYNATIILRSDGSRLKKRKTRKARRRRKCTRPDASMVPDIVRIAEPMTRVSNQFHPEMINSQKKVAKLRTQIVR